MGYTLLHQLALCCLLINSDYQVNEFVPPVKLETQLVKFQAGPRNEAALLTFRAYRVLVFRGTVSDWKAQTLSSFVDWVKNFQQGQTECPPLPGKVHRGLMKETGKLLAFDDQSLLKYLNRVQKEDPLPLYVTGHSQGGAVALLAASRLQQQGIKIQEVVLFGAPRVGDVVFGDHCRAQLNVRRFEQQDDFVPLLPLSSTEAGKIKKWLDHAKTGAELTTLLKPSVGEHFKTWHELTELLSEDLPVYDRIGTLTLLNADAREIPPEEEEASIRQRWRSAFLRSITKPKSFLKAHDSRGYATTLEKFKSR